MENGEIIWNFGKPFEVSWIFIAESINPFSSNIIITFENKRKENKLNTNGKDAIGTLFVEGSWKFIICLCMKVTASFFVFLGCVLFVSTFLWFWVPIEEDEVKKPYILDDIVLAMDLETIPKEGEKETKKFNKRYNLQTVLDHSIPWKSKNELEHKLCIVVPFRESQDKENNGKNRTQHLIRFKHYMRHFLSYQNVSYTLLVIEQEQGLLFNRGSLLNAGFLLAYDQCDYLALHDVDSVPGSIRNTYSYPTQPEHACTKFRETEQLRSRLPAYDMLGCVLFINLHDYHRINGFSNGYWGWGFEDNDLYWRVRYSGLEVKRYNQQQGEYLKFSHERNFGTETKQHQVSVDRYFAMKHGEIDHHQEGLSTVDFTILKRLSDTETYKHYTIRLHNHFNLI